MSLKFNERFNDKGEKPAFIYKRNPLVPHSFQIFGLILGKETYEPIGDYTLLDLSEAIEVTEKKVINLVALLNGKRDLVSLGNLTKTRLLYTIVQGTPESKNEKIIFRTYDGDGVSIENAVLNIEKGVFNETPI
jgi:hypothetical protein